jgi:TRAP transporter TAXI family solute receptor
MTRRQRRTLQWTLIIALTAIAFWITLALSEPAPPSRFTLAGGLASSSYDRVVRDLAVRVEVDDGPAVEIRNSSGSVDNLRALADGTADAALVQSGVVSAVAGTIETGSLRAIARLYSEPLWVIYRGERELTLLNQLRPTGTTRQRIYIGPDGSGTQIIARELLRANGVDARNAELVPGDSKTLLDLFARGEIDVAFIVAAPDSETLGKLFRLPGARAMNFSNHRAYARRLPYLAAIEVSQGVLSLEENLPAQPLLLLAPSATLVAREDLHPRVVEKLTKAVVARFSGGNLIDLAGEYPSSHGLEVPQHPAAQHYLAEGESWATRNLPFWLLRLLASLKLALIPILTVLIPAIKIVPRLLGMSVARAIQAHYAKLQKIEDRIRRAKTVAEVEAGLADNERLRDEVAALSHDLPTRYQNTVYDFRLHANLVRQEGIERLAGLQG